MEQNKDYLHKENYLVFSDNMNIWRRHPNYFIIHDSKEYLKGDCIDIGCNIGILSIHLSELESISSITGLDINSSAVNKARELAKVHGFSHKSTFECLNLVTDDTRKYNQKFDSMISFHTLEHIYPEDADVFIKKQYDMLKPGAYCLIIIPYDHAYPDPCHVAFYKEDSLRSLYERHNFRTVKCFKDDRWHEKDLLHGVFQKPFETPTLQSYVIIMLIILSLMMFVILSRRIIKN